MNKQLLQSVSRSFYLTICYLPAPMRRATAVAYMLARATDSVADTSSADREKRADILRQMGRAISGRLAAGEQAHLLASLASEMAGQQQNPAEQRLLSVFGDCLAEMEALPPRQIKLIRHVLHTILKGQLWDLRYFTPERVQVATDADTRRYTYLVAGCVGAFWTRLGLETLGRDFLPDPADGCPLCRAAVRYGQGLQLINILRDRAEDAARGRNYLSSPARLWLDRAQRYMEDGLDYSRRLGRFRLRFASMLPALIGLKTLAALRRAPEGVRVKISRRAVYGCMAKALWLSVLRQGA